MHFPYILMACAYIYSPEPKISISLFAASLACYACIEARRMILKWCEYKDD